MERLSSVLDLQTFLNEHVGDLEKALDVYPVQFYIPLDGEYPHLRVSVTEGKKELIPKELAFDFKGEQVLIPLEVDEDYQEFVAF